MSRDDRRELRRRRRAALAGPKRDEGFALIAVLWLVATLSVLLSLGLAPTVVAQHAAENRLGQTRALWAARGCLALIQARHADGRKAVMSDSVALGPVTWCEVERIDPDVRVNPNTVDSVGLSRVLRDSVQVSSLLDWMDGDRSARTAGAEVDWYVSRQRHLPRNGPIADVREILLVRGFDEVPIAALDEIFTVRGDGGVSPNRADLGVLRSVSVLPPGAAEEIVSLRSTNGAFRTTEDVVLRLGLELTIDEFRRLVQSLSFNENRRTVRIHGRVDVGRRWVGSELIAALTQVDDRLAVTGLEVR